MVGAMWDPVDVGLHRDKFFFLGERSDHDRDVPTIIFTLFFIFLNGPTARFEDISFIKFGLSHIPQQTQYTDIQLGPTCLRCNFIFIF